MGTEIAIVILSKEKLWFEEIKVEIYFWGSRWDPLGHGTQSLTFLYFPSASFSVTI
jgi:hypothetical protein